MKRVEQQFLQGLNERVPEDRDTGTRFLKLKNARLFVDGETGYVGRMKGFVRLWGDKWKEYQSPIGHIVVQGDHETLGYLKGIRVKLTDSLYLQDETNLEEPTALAGQVRITDHFIYRRGIVNQTPSDSIELRDRFRYKRLRILRFKDTLNLQDETVFPRLFYVYLEDQLPGIIDSSAVRQITTFRLQFADSLAMSDQTKNKPLKTIKLFDSLQLKDEDLECLDE